MDRQAFIQACRDGGAALERALRELDRAFSARLLRECAQSVRDRDIAADLVQETLIKVWRHCASFRGESELLPWIRVILRRTVLDRLRKGQHEVTLDDDALAAASDAAAYANGAHTQTDMAVRATQSQAVFEICWQRFQASAPEHATVMGWIVEDGMTNTEVAALLGRTPGATREFISQCRKRARVHLAQWYALTSAEESP